MHLLEKDMAGQGIAIGVQAIGGETENRVTRLNPAPIDYSCPLNDTDNAASEIVFPFAIHPRHLCGFAPDERTSSGATGAGETLKELMKHSRLQFFTPNVIEKKKRLSTNDGNIVDTMVDQIGPNSVMLVHGKSDFQLRSNTIDAGHQDRVPHSWEPG